MVTDTREPRRNYPVPDVANNVSDEFERLIQAVTMIGNDTATALETIATKAPLDHGHSISQIVGLQGVLDTKLSSVPPLALNDLSDVDVAGAANLQVLMRVAGQWVPGVISFTNLINVPTQFTPAPHTQDAGTITTGVFDPARIPVIASGVQVMSSGGIAQLSVAQQADVTKGAIVTTTDGRRWIYSGSGSKTSEASYIELGDVTPEWNAVANKPAVINNIQAHLDARAVLGTNVYFGDVTANRGNGSGVVYFAGSYIFYDGSNWQFSGGGGIYLNGSRVHTDANFQPVTDVRLAGWWGHDAWANGSDNWSPDLWGGVVCRIHFRQTGQVMAAMECAGRYVQKLVNGTWYTVANA